MSSSRQTAPSTDFFGGWFAADFLDQVTGDLTNFVHRVDHVHRDADRAALVRDRSRDRLANPPGCVGAEFVATSMLEFVDRSHQAGVAFLDQVQERQAAVAILFGDRNDQPQVAGRQDAFGGVVVVAISIAFCRRDEPVFWAFRRSFASSNEVRSLIP